MYELLRFEMENVLFYISSKTKARLFHVVVAVGLDINLEKFHENVKMMEEKMNAFYGKIDFRTFEKFSPNNSLDSLFHFKSKQFIHHYIAFATDVLVLTEKDLTDPTKTKSHTAPTFLYSIKGDFGLKRTFVAWEPIDEKGQRGVQVLPQHSVAYFFDAPKVQQLKLLLNNKF